MVAEVVVEAVVVDEALLEEDEGVDAMDTSSSASHSMERVTAVAGQGTSCTSATSEAGHRRTLPVRGPATSLRILARRCRSWQIPTLTRSIPIDVWVCVVLRGWRMMLTTMTTLTQTHSMKNNSDKHYLLSLSQSRKETSVAVRPCRRHLTN